MVLPRHTASLISDSESSHVFICVTTSIEESYPAWNILDRLLDKSVSKGFSSSTTWESLVSPFRKSHDRIFGSTGICTQSQILIQGLKHVCDANEPYDLFFMVICFWPHDLAPGISIDGAALLELYLRTYTVLQ